MGSGGGCSWRQGDEGKLGFEGGREAGRDARGGFKAGRDLELDLEERRGRRRPRWGWATCRLP